MMQGGVEVVEGDLGDLAGDGVEVAAAFAGVSGLFPLRAYFRLQLKFEDAVLHQALGLVRGATPSPSIAQFLFRVGWAGGDVQAIRRTQGT